MAWVTTDYKIKYNGKFYKAGEKFQVNDEELPEILESGAKEISPSRGRPKGRTRQDAVLEWEEGG